MVFTLTYPQVLKVKNRLKISLESANLQEHFDIILAL